ncbi:hypothetical protein [Nostoc sp. C117]|uniref:barstar family protein n=1 Tax=Nostoc sp. C117 TaxID=3349875 RepID=UPI00370D636B
MENQDIATYVLPGENIKSLQSFYEVFGEMVNGRGGYFGKNLVAFEDCLLGGFGLELPCKIIFKNSNIARKTLDHRCLADWCKFELENDEDLYCEGFESGLKWFKDTYDKASQGLGETMFDILVEIIRRVGRRDLFSNLGKEICLIIE